MEIGDGRMRMCLACPAWKRNQGYETRPMALGKMAAHAILACGLAWPVTAQGAFDRVCLVDAIADWPIYCPDTSLKDQDLRKWGIMTGADLRFSDMRNADLREQDLRAADLRMVLLDGANLRNAILDYADLRNASLTGASLVWARLQYADLRHADLSGADLSNAFLTGADLVGANLSGASLTGAFLQKANLRGMDLRHIDLKGAVVDIGTLSGTIYSIRDFAGLGIYHYNTIHVLPDDVTKNHWLLKRLNLFP